MTNIEIIKEMFALQQKLNDETNGLAWENGYTKNNRIINWKRCISMECAELIDSFNWKHWKDIDKDIDWENATIEVVDIWHFVMSLMLEDYKVNGRGDLDSLVNDIIDIQGFELFTKEPHGRDSVDSMALINDIESIMNLTTSYDMKIHEGLLKEYFSLALKCGVNLKSLYKYYVAKNILNKFRQDNGYKEGTYKKVWNGKEDNEVMLGILNDESLGADMLYKELDKAYNNR
jgi:dimeric dUTPase (all-alpha-NTP-PPase superfamily)